MSKEWLHNCRGVLPSLCRIMVVLARVYIEMTVGDKRASASRENSTKNIPNDEDAP